MKLSRFLPVAAAIGVAVIVFSRAPRHIEAEPAIPDRSPADFVLTPDERLILTANRTSDTVSLVRVETGEILAEVPCGQEPSAITLTPDGKTALVSCTFSGEVFRLRIDGDTLAPDDKLYLGFEPRGLAVSPDGATAYVALGSGSAVAVIDLAEWKESGRIPTGRWPRHLALSPDGSRLAVGVSGSGGVAVIDTEKREQLFIEDFIGLNLGQMYPSKDGKHVYVPWMVYRHNPITQRNIQLGWVLASRVARVRLDEQARREAISLDPQGEAVADPHGIALSPDEQWMVCAASGTKELLVYKLPGLPFQDYGGPGDHIDPQLLNDTERFYRIPLGGRPMTVRYSKDGRHAYVANYLLNAIQVVDVPGRKVVRTIDLGGPSEESLVRRGEEIFFDGGRSLDQWYSCHSCHYEGGTNAVSMDTRNDGRFGNFKTVLTLRHVGETGPWTWHGWQDSLEESVRKSMIDTMLGRSPSDEDVAALTAYLKTLRQSPNPHRNPDGSLSPAAERGKAVFHGEKAGCVRCHKEPYYTRERTYDVLTGEPRDAFDGFNPPMLVGVYDRVKLLHDGRAESLRELLRSQHNPDKLIGNGELTDAELADLIEYLKSL